MTLYDQTKMTEREYTTTAQRRITKIGIKDGSPMVCWNPTKINSSKHIVCFEAN